MISFNLVQVGVLFHIICKFAKNILGPFLIGLFLVFIAFGNLFIKFIACIFSTVAG